MKIDYLFINDLLYENFDAVIEAFNLEIRAEGDQYVGICPIHPEADNPTAFRVYDNGKFCCFTRHCHREGNSLLDLIQSLLLIHLNLDYNIYQVVLWCIDHIFNGNYDLDIPREERIKETYVPKIFYNNIIDWCNFAAPVPSPYFISLGFKSSTIEKFFIGECRADDHRFFNRVVVPQFDKSDNILGYTGRSLYVKCSKCKLYHSQLAPCPIQNKSYYGKWRHAKGFSTSQHLYGDWRLDGCREVILVESVGNTIRVVESGFNNTLGIYGNRLSMGQSNILDNLGVRYINWIIDNDENKAGLEGALEAQKRYKQYKFKIIVPPVGYNDIKELSTNKTFLFLRSKGIKYD